MIFDELISDESLEDEEPGVYVNTKTGETAPAFATDSTIVGEDAVVDVESDDWILLEEDDSRRIGRARAALASHGVHAI